MVWKRILGCWALGLLGFNFGGFAQVQPNQGSVDPLQFMAEIPFAFHQNHIYVKAKINGVEGNFIFDNGFTVTGLDNDFAARCGIQASPDSGVILADANETEAKGQLGNASDLQLAEVHFKDTRVAIIDTDGLPSCQKVDGFIGSSVINKANWRIDFDNKTLHLASRPFLDAGLRCAYTISQSNRHFIEFRYEGVPFWVHIDLGSSGELELNKAAFTPLFSGLHAQMNVGASSLALFGLSAVDTFYTLNRPYKFGYDKYVITNAPRIELQREVEYARLGLGYLYQFNLIINSDAKEYILTPNRLIRPNRDDKDYGIVFYPVGGVHRIVRLSACENVSKYGFVLGEVIEKIDGQAIETLGDWCSLKTYIRGKADKSEPLRLKIRGRKEECILNAEYSPAHSIVR
jgi:hypothetical protein